MVEECSKVDLTLHVRHTISFSIALKLISALFDCAVHSMFKSILGSVIPSSWPTFYGFSLLENWKGRNGGSLVPRPCAFIACSTKSTQNFVLQATNAWKGGNGGYIADMVYVMR